MKRKKRKATELTFPTIEVKSAYSCSYAVYVNGVDWWLVSAGDQGWHVDRRTCTLTICRTVTDAVNYLVESVFNELQGIEEPVEGVW